MKKIIAFSGSNSSKSINQQLVKAVSLHINNDAFEVEILNLRDYSAPIYCIDDETATGFPETINALFDKFSTADGFIVASPEHNGSMPAVLKNTIDWLSRLGRKVFNDKPTLFLSTSPGPRGGLSALQHLLGIMPHQGAKVVGGHALGSFNSNVQGGVIVDGENKEQILTLLKQLETAISQN